jgi:hypothetical protein
VNDTDEVERIGSRQHVDRVLAELVDAAGHRSVDADTLRQLARIRLEQFDDLDLVELMLLAAGMFAELGIRNAQRAAGP